MRVQVVEEEKAGGRGGGRSRAGDLLAFKHQLRSLEPRGLAREDVPECRGPDDVLDPPHEP